MSAGRPSTDPERWRKVEGVFFAALDHAPESRKDFLDGACTGDVELRQEVESLLEKADRSGSFLKQSPMDSASAPILPGTRLGPYRIVALLGKGGMGEVYRAHDPKLNRDVAIKVLPAALASDSSYTARFQREAQTLAALNHPNIAVIHGLEDHAIVMELVEGPTLADRIAKGPMSLDEALPIVRQIAEALEAAHEKGIIHRDLKPGNVKIAPGGVVKVLDFGLAKITTESAAGAAASHVATLTRATQPGWILGTPAYMSPEQARGEQVDKRTDIWAFGCVLYEMLTGQRAFPGQTVSDTLATVLAKEPDLDKVPAKALRLVRTCLEKDPKHRLQAIGDWRLLLEDVAPPKKTASNRIAWAAAALLGVSLAALAFVHFRQRPPEAMIERFSIPAPDKTTFNFIGPQGGPVQISPDGRRLVFSATSADGKALLWVRSLASLEAVPLAGTESASHPFWSADSQNIGFFADGKLKRVDAAGGPALTICDAPIGNGGTWNRDGVIVFSPSNNGPLYRVSASGGAANPVTELDAAKHETRHSFPWFLPDGRHFLYWAGAASFSGGTIRAASIDAPGRDSRIIMPSRLGALYSQGYLLFLRENTLMAQPFDATRLEITGEALPVAEQIHQIQTIAGSRRAVVAVSANGFLVYQTGGSGDFAQLAWFDRSGKQTGTLGQPDNLTAVRFSPDRKSVAIDILDPATQNRDIWLYDVARELKTRFTFDTHEREAIWSPDGRSIVFDSSRKGQFDLYRKPSNGAGADELLYADGKTKFPTSFSSDGNWLLYMVYFDPKSQLWILPMDGTQGSERKPVPFAPTAFNSSWGQFSPDGRWIAYASDESSRNEIYVASFPGPGGKRQISTGGGDQPLWRADGKEMFYIGADRRLMAAEVSSSGDSFEVGAARPLFGPIPVSVGHLYDVSADGQRFIVRIMAQGSNSEPLTLVQNWTAALKK